MASSQRNIIPQHSVNREDIPGRGLRKEIETLKSHFMKHNGRKSIPIAHHRAHSIVLDWSADGDRLAAGYDDNTIIVLQTVTGRLKEEMKLSGHSESIDQICWHPSDGRLLASTASDRSVRLWDVRKRGHATVIHTPGQNINLCFSPNGKYIGVGSKDDLLSFYNITMANKDKAIEKQFKVEVNEFAWDINSTVLHVTSGPGEIILLNWPDLKQLRCISAHPTNCISIGIDPCGKYFSVGSTDACYSNWCAQTYTPLNVVRRLESPVRTLEYTSDGKLIAAASEDNYIDICHPEKGSKIYSVETDGPILDVSWHPKRYLLAYFCDTTKSSRRDTRDTRGSGTATDFSGINLFGLDTGSQASAAAASTSTPSVASAVSTARH